jgi:hypothetical protein
MPTLPGDWRLLLVTVVAAVVLLAIGWALDPDHGRRSSGEV